MVHINLLSQIGIWFACEYIKIYGSCPLNTKWSVSPPKNIKMILIRMEIKTVGQSRCCWINTLQWLISMGRICVQPLLIQRVWRCMMGGFLKRWLTAKALTHQGHTYTKCTQQMRIRFSLPSFWASLNIKNHSHPSHTNRLKMEWERKSENYITAAERTWQLYMLALQAFTWMENVLIYSNHDSHYNLKHNIHFTIDIIGAHTLIRFNFISSQWI